MGSASWSSLLLITSSSINNIDVDPICGSIIFWTWHNISRCQYFHYFCISLICHVYNLFRRSFSSYWLFNLVIILGTSTCSLTCLQAFFRHRSILRLSLCNININGAYIASVCDIITISSHQIYEWIILWTSGSYLSFWGSRWGNDNSFLKYSPAIYFLPLI